MTSCLRSVRGAVLGLFLVPSAFAIAPHVPEGLAPGAAARLSSPPFVLPSVDAAQSKQWAASDPAFRAFVAEAGAEWQARWDARTARLSFAFGTFPNWLPSDARARTPDDAATTPLFTKAFLSARCGAAWPCAPAWAPASGRW